MRDGGQCGCLSAHLQERQLLPHSCDAPKGQLHGLPYPSPVNLFVQTGDST